MRAILLFLCAIALAAACGVKAPPRPPLASGADGGPGAEAEAPDGGFPCELDGGACGR